MADCCRLCLFESVDGCRNVFSPDERPELLPQILKYLCIEIKPDDIHSKHVCQKCIDCIMDFDRYWCKVASNQQLLEIVSTAAITSMSMPIYITNGPKLPVAELQPVTQYSIKTENGVYTLQPTTPPIESVSVPNSPVPTKESVNFTGVNDADSITNELEIEPVIDLTTSDKDESELVRISTKTPPLNDPSDCLVTFVMANRTDVWPDAERLVTNNDLTVAKLPVDQRIPKKRKLNLSQKEKKLKTSSNECTGESKLIRVEIENMTSSISTCNENDADASSDTSKTDLFDEEEDDGCYESDTEVNLLEKSEKMLGEAETGYDNNCNDKFMGFPKVMIKNSKLLYRGGILLSLMSKFFRLECDLCIETGCKPLQTFNCVSTLYAHFAEVHSIKGYVICCGLKLFKPRAMAMHMSRHLQPDAFRCVTCDKMMTCPKILQYHMQNHLPENQRPLACPDCPRKFSYSSALIAHSISHLPESERVAHICDECGKSFLSPGRLSTHINVAHVSHGPDFICHVCAKQFACRSNLSYHLTTHQPRIHQVQCTQCDKWLKNKLCLRKHMVQHSQVWFSCDRCDYSALNRQCVRNHIKVQHSDIKPYSCQICGNTFKLRNTLLNHMAQHTGIKKFACEFCDRTFASSGNYYSHRKRMHKDQLAAANERKEAEDSLLRQKMIKNEDVST